MKWLEILAMDSSVRMRKFLFVVYSGGLWLKVRTLAMYTNGEYHIPKVF